MPTRRSGDALKPSIRIAPLGELKAWPVYEHELDELARGSPASLYLNFSLSLFSSGMTLLVALLTTTITSDRLFDVFVIGCVISLLASSVLGTMWLRSHSSTSGLIDRIKSRMPPSPAIQEDAAGPPAAEE
jgi:hypothetical protein